MKKRYTKPVLETEEFVPNEYVAACTIVKCLGGDAFWKNHDSSGEMFVYKNGYPVFTPSDKILDMGDGDGDGFYKAVGGTYYNGPGFSHDGTDYGQETKTHKVEYVEINRENYETLKANPDYSSLEFGPNAS